MQTIKLIKKRRHILNKDIKYKTESVTEGSRKQVKRWRFPFWHLAFICHIFSANGVRNYCYFSHIVATVKPKNEYKHCNQLMDTYAITSATLPHRKQLSSFLSYSLATKAAISLLALIVVTFFWKPHSKHFQSKQNIYTIIFLQADILLYFFKLLPAFVYHQLPARTPLVWPASVWSSCSPHLVPGGSH